ncbi:MAG: dephospho-CoA kinase [Bacteroidota bacterium]
MALNIGITGGIGSGKTTVCKIFELLGIPVYYADDRAKWIITHQKEVVKQIKAACGVEAYTPEGDYNRPYIANIVFQDRNRLETLNQIVHPAVFLDGLEWQKSHANQPYTLKEAALLFESGSYQMHDKIICVTAPEEIRIQRVMKRDSLDRAAVQARIDKQLPEAEKVDRSDYVIHNFADKSLIRQVLDIHQALLALAKQASDPNL